MTVNISSPGDSTDIPFYKTIERSFHSVSLLPGITTSDFCEAVDVVVRFLGLFDNGPFGIIRSDIGSKNAIVRERYDASPENSMTVEAILADEKAIGRGGKSDSVTIALTWLIRTLRLICLGLRDNMTNPDEEVSVSLTRAYGVTMRPYHSWAMRPIFALAMKAVPNRANFYKVLGSPEEEVMRELDAWLTGLEVVLARLQVVYEEGKFGQL